VPKELSVIQINAELVARKEQGRDSWEILDSERMRGRVVKTAAGFQALRSWDGDYYSVGTYITLESAGKAVGR
jgi:hypothetical protein